jgi:hypothetical protein
MNFTISQEVEEEEEEIEEEEIIKEDKISINDHMRVLWINNKINKDYKNSNLNLLFHHLRNNHKIKSL